jgi:3-hydroxyisobutyrate dehydrogenase-like beta-hydroxyacid dehydrogenase
MAPVPFQGTAKEAAEWILDEILCDFPFQDSPSKTNALAMFLLPYFRASIDGPTPLHFIDAPVSGGNLGAINGTLTVMCGGDAEAFERARPVAMAYAKAMTLLGGSGAGQLAKMVNQIAIAGLLQGLSEAIAFGERAGLDMKAVLAVIGQGAAQSWQMDQRGGTMVDGQFDFGFAVDWMRKDLSICLEEARRNGSNLPVTALVDQFYAEVQKMGGRRWDTSSLFARLER